MGTKTLPELQPATPAATDIVNVVIDPSGTPLSKKCTVAAIVAAGLVDVVGNAQITGLFTLKNPTGGATDFVYDPTESPALFAMGGAPLASSFKKTLVVTSSSEINSFGIDVVNNYAPTSDTVHIAYGIRSTIFSSIDNPKNMDLMFAGYFETLNRSVGHAVTVLGIFTSAAASRAGLTDTLAAIQTAVRADTNTTVATNGIGLDIKAFSGPGTFTNKYGIRVGNMAGGVTLNYAIYTGTGNIHFGGIPTSSAGLITGDVWSNSGVLTIV